MCPKPATRNPRRATRDAQPATRNAQPATRNTLPPPTRVQTQVYKSSLESYANRPVANVIRACLHISPRGRPTFSVIMGALQGLQAAQRESGAVP
jgi:hypothetical protein